ncbi:MAG: hypothetical protein M0C28_26245, partial [Candidatus Moduliflexus flocculans]|nr:hypothetical protein [Candidatus Moduliflexus flocculans]
LRIAKVKQTTTTESTAPLFADVPLRSLSPSIIPEATGLCDIRAGQAGPGGQRRAGADVPVPSAFLRQPGEGPREPPTPRSSSRCSTTTLGKRVSVGAELHVAPH